MLQVLSALLSRPFPLPENLPSALRLDAAVSVFVFGVLYLLGPFGMAEIETGRAWICFGFALTLFATLGVVSAGLQYLTKARGTRARLTFGEWLLAMCVILVLVSLTNFLYARMVMFGYVDWQFYPQMAYATVVIGVVPFAVIGWVSLRLYESRYQTVANTLNAALESPATLPGAEVSGVVESPSVFGVPVAAIRYIEAQQNYVRVVHVDGDGQAAELRYRMTLREAEVALAKSSVVRAHRSFLVNRSAVSSASGNAQGLELVLDGVADTVPVARSKVAAFRNLMH